MDYRDSNGGRIETQGSDRGRFVSFEMTQERLVAAMDTWWRLPDRERGWLHVKAAWPDILRFPWRVGVDGEHDEREAVTVQQRPRPTRDEIAEMEEASDWLLIVEERDRRLVAMVLAAKARGLKKVPWHRIWDRLGRGKPGPEGLRKRYSKAVSDITIRLNR